jgi:hypothetical protein
VSAGNFISFSPIFLGPWDAEGHPLERLSGKLLRQIEMKV